MREKKKKKATEIFPSLTVGLGYEGEERRSRELDIISIYICGLCRRVLKLQSGPKSDRSVMSLMDQIHLRLSPIYKIHRTNKSLSFESFF